MKFGKVNIKKWEWHKWFAWHPIPLGDSWVWLGWVERKKKAEWSEIFWEYRELKSI